MPEQQINCKYFREHMVHSRGDSHVFHYAYGEILMCDNSSCPHNYGKFLVDGEEPAIGRCLPEERGLKEIVAEAEVAEPALAAAVA